MNFDRIRRQKIDKNYIDDAFKELPLFESMAVSSDKESYRFATELLGMEHVHSTPTMRNNKDDNYPNSSSATLKSMYFDEGISEYIDSSARVNTDHYGHDVHPGKYSFREKDATQFSSIKNIESNTLPQILRSKPLESPGKIRSDKPLKGDQDEAVRESYAREEAWRITENSPPSWNDLNEFKGMFSDMKRIIMKALLLDMQKKENDYFVINQLNAEKIGKMYAKKIFLMFESQEEVLDTKHSRYNENYNLIRSRINGYFDLIQQGDETQDRKPLLHVFLVYQKGKVWEYSKIKVEGTRNTGVYFWTSVYNPVSMIKVSRNDMLDNYAEILLKSLVLKQPVLKKSGIGKTGLDKDTTARNSVCSVWDSGVEVYKKIAKSYAELSQEKISRDQMYFLLLERYHDSQVGV